MLVILITVRKRAIISGSCAQPERSIISRIVPFTEWLQMVGSNAAMSSMGAESTLPLLKEAVREKVKCNYSLILIIIFILAIQDESFSIDFGLAVGGVVGYANSGPHCNGSQFFITLGPCDWMNQKFVGFGRVIQGFSALKTLNSLRTSNQVPDRNIIISACGDAPIDVE